MNTGNKRKKWRIVNYFYLVLILFTLWISATYTWFSISRTPRVSDMQLSVGSTAGVEIAFNITDEEWSNFLNFGEVLEEIDPLKPVSWVDEDKRFYAARYGVDGRINGIDIPLTDEYNANKNNFNSYYMITSFYMRSDVDARISLSEAVTNEDGTQGSGTYVIGSPVWNSDMVLHNNGGHGAEYAVRVGIKITKVDENGNENADSVQFYVYEPNYDGHVDGSTGAFETQSIKGKETLVDEEYMIRQTTSRWKEFYPVTKNVVVQELGKFEKQPNLFEMKANEFVKIDLYFWLEGQDIDCGYLLESDAQIMANFQFLAEQDGQSGLEEFR